MNQLQLSAHKKYKFSLYWQFADRHAQDNMLELTGNAYKRHNLPETPICFLDFDGVLHPDEAYYSPRRGIHLLAADHHLFEWAEILARLLEPHPSIRLVLSTSWVPMRSFAFAKSRLPDELKTRVIGSTYHSRDLCSKEFSLYSRGEQVCRYVAKHRLKRWCAIDDDSDGWPEWCRAKFIQTDGETGLNDDIIQSKIREIFASL